MPSLKDLLQRTMLFTAAQDGGIDAYSALNHAPGDAISFPLPTPSAATPAEDRAVWNWTHDPAKPGTISNLNAWMQAAGMAMTVCDKVEVESVSISVKADEPAFSLPLTKDYVIAKYALASAKLSARTSGWWQLEAKLDCSILVVFGYDVTPASGDPMPLSLDRIEALGDRFFPAPDVPSDDPDAPPAGSSPNASSNSVSVGESIVAHIGSTWVIVAFGFSTCKERADFEPGKILGAGRIYPHVMVAANRPTLSAEAKVHIVRPAKVMMHSAESLPDVGAIFMADTNEVRTPGGYANKPLPLWSNFFDYYDLSPQVGSEVKFVDPRLTSERTVAKGMQRESVLRVTDPYESSSTFKKLPRQGAFDNVHLAPRMKFSNPSTGVTIPTIVMAPFCEHDCLHTHTRWGNPTSWSATSSKGFSGRKPYSTMAAPMVPEDQTIFITLTSPASIRYRAVSGKTATGAWTVFNHHGSAYSLSIADPTSFSLARFGVAAAVIQLMEPYTRDLGLLVPFFDREIVDVDPGASLAAFYQRLQFTGLAAGDVFMPRIKILDLDLCRRS